MSGFVRLPEYKSFDLSSLVPWVRSNLNQRNISPVYPRNNWGRLVRRASIGYTPRQFWLTH